MSLGHGHEDFTSFVENVLSPNTFGKSLDSIGHASPGLGLSAPHSALRGNTPSSVLPSSGDWSPNHGSQHSLSGTEFKICFNDGPLSNTSSPLGVNNHPRMRHKKKYAAGTYTFRTYNESLGVKGLMISGFGGARWRSMRVGLDLFISPALL